MKHLYSDLNKEQIAERLIKIAESKLLVQRTVNKYRNNPHYSMIFNKEDVESEMYSTVFLVMNALERYNANKDLISQRETLESKLTKKEMTLAMSNKMTPTLKTKISKALKKKVSEVETFLPQMMEASNGDLKLDTESQITGYLIVAFTNNIKKIYSKQQAEKRSFDEMIYLDSYTGDSPNSSMMKNKLEAVGSFDPTKEKDFNKNLVNMALFLKKYDKRMNQINQNEKSKLAQLFCSIVNPKKVEDTAELKERFGWSQYLLNKNKETIIKKIQEEFSDIQEEVISYLDQREDYKKAA